jgi:hypothetical protein
MVSSINKLIVAALAAAFVVGCGSSQSTAPEMPAGAYLIENGKVKVNLEQVPSLGKVGGVVKISNPGLPEPLIVLRVTEKGFVTLSLTCAKKGNELEYLPEEKKFKCMGKGSLEFGPDAAVLGDKPDKPVQMYPTTLAIFDRDKLIIRID